MWKENELEIEYSEYLNAVNKLTTFKSPGNTGIGGEIYQSLNDEIHKIIYECLVVLWENDNKILPEWWDDASKKMILKKGFEGDGKNYRPITTQNYCHKIFSSIIKEKMNKYCVENNIINDLQFGFKPQFSTHQAIRTYIDILEDAKQYKKSLYVCQIDANKAFDSVDWEVLKKIMIDYGFDKKYIKRVMKMLKNKKAHLNTPLGKSDSFEVTRGSPQGDPISAIIFSIFINPLIEKLNNDVKGYRFSNNKNLAISCIAYADDITLFAEDHVDMQKLLDIVQKFSEQTGLTINVSKTILTTNQKKNKGDIFLIENNEKKILKYTSRKKSIRYLGIYLSINMDKKLQEKMLNDKVKYYMSLIRYRRFTPIQKIYLINRVIIPKIQYAMNFVKLDDSAIDNMNRQIQSVVNFSLGYQHNLSYSALSSEFGLSNLHDVQIESYTSTMLNQCINFPSKFPRKTLIERNNSLTNELKNTGNNLFENCILNLKNMLKKINISVEIPVNDIKLIYRDSIVLKNYITKFNDEDKYKNYEAMNIEDNVYIIIATDGSSKNTTNGKRASSAYTFGSGKLTKAWRSRYDDSFSSEVEAVWGAISSAPINENICIY